MNDTDYEDDRFDSNPNSNAKIFNYGVIRAVAAVIAQRPSNRLIREVLPPFVRTSPARFSVTEVVAVLIVVLSGLAMGIAIGLEVFVIVLAFFCASTI